MIYYNPLNKIYASSLLDDATGSSGFTTRELGDGRNLEIVLSFLRLNQVIFKKLVVAEQIHSANVAYLKNVSHTEAEIVKETDGLVTGEKGVVIAVRTADCIPILYKDPVSGLIAVSHNGWRGALKNISQRTISVMVEAGAKKEDIRVALGPGIGSCCYDIDEERYYSFMEEYETDFGAFSMHAGKRHLNLTRLNYELLVRSGINGKNIDFFPFCTMCNKQMFFSFRRDFRKHKEHFGEMFSYIVVNQ